MAANDCWTVRANQLFRVILLTLDFDLAALTLLAIFFLRRVFKGGRGRWGLFSGGRLGEAVMDLLSNDLRHNWDVRAVLSLNVAATVKAMLWSVLLVLHFQELWLFLQLLDILVLGLRNERRFPFFAHIHTFEMGDLRKAFVGRFVVVASFLLTFTNRLSQILFVLLVAHIGIPIVTKLGRVELIGVTQGVKAQCHAVRVLFERF